MGRDIQILTISLLGPLVGSLIGILFRPRESILFGLISFAGGTMLGISFLEMLPDSLVGCGVPGTVTGLCVGVLVMLLAGSWLEGVEHQSSRQHSRMETASLMMVAAIFLHNLPEGIAMAAGGQVAGPQKAMLIAIAIATHDIPEGICTSAPYYYATGKRARAFWQSASTALPVLLGYYLGKSIFASLSGYTMGMILAAVAGMMIYVSCKELIPTAQSGHRQKTSAAMLMLGIVFVLALGAMQG